ncbi:MAG TPA: 4-(cytidine 5'-diphospho)-2-C-methyl-D-erythritol kinase [Porphyromonadaceae bacterium]|nr:4-(cytidine 5'-diphospho)-2-C-methyl-D-erythritol kinase [Porphyromonadaceae bacterium]
MICFPNAKINLGLNIVGEREDGYHNLETIFYPLQLCDVLEIVPSKGENQLHISGLPIQGDVKNNLVWKALHLVSQKEGLPSMDIYLHKVIPMGAGLGGGSSDATSMLKLLNDFCGGKILKEELSNDATSLGADCNFFLHNVPVFAYGIGDKIEPIALSLKGMHLLLVKPPLEVSTREAYANISSKKRDFPLKEIVSLPIQEWKKYIFNDFEENVFPLYPQIKEIKNELYRIGALYASMSGSGSSVFGIFEKMPEDMGKFTDCFLWREELKY